MSKTNQERKGLPETLHGWLPTDPNTFVFECVVVTYLIVGVIDFAKKGDGSMLTTLLPYGSAYVGLTKVEPLFLRRKGRGDSDSSQSQEAE